MKSTYLVDVTSVTEIYGDGQRMIAAILEYTVSLPAAALSPSCFAAAGLRVSGVTVSDTYRGPAKRSGRFVELILVSDTESSSTKISLGTGRHGRTAIRPADLMISQMLSLKAENGEILPAFNAQPSTRTDNGIADRFVGHTYECAETGQQLNYNFFMPENCVPGQKYPLVLFMHDAGSCSDQLCTALAQGSGAIVWARESLMGKRPCFVVAPQYPEVCASDEFQVTWPVDVTVRLINSLTGLFPIDRARIYGTGQSMGCMMLCEMLLCYPNLFAGSLLVAGQWDPERMPAAKDAQIWAIVAEGDAKAFPIMGQCFDNMEQAGGRVSRGHIDAGADTMIIDQQIRRQKALSCNLNFTWFEGGTILPPGCPDHPGMHHVSTWIKAYDVESLREWLFEQRLNSLNGL